MGALHAFGMSDPGCKRTHNEDRIVIAPPQNLYVLADGMGGERCGELAAEICTGTIREYFSKDSREEEWPFDYDPTLNLSQNQVMNGIRLANRRIWETCQVRPECEGMGSTISVLLCQGETATIGNIGDSRVYLLRHSHLRVLTRDDAVVADMIDAGEITEEEARSHPMRNVLTSALGKAQDVAVQLVQFQLGDGDRLLLCSDGLYAVVTHATIEHLLKGNTDPAAVANGLIRAARSAGGPDNISCIVVDYSDASTEAHKPV